MLTLYGNPFSPNSRKVHWALEELGLPYEYKTLDLIRAREQKRESYLLLNPNGRVPTLVDDDFVLYESNAILWYVSDKFGAGRLVPEDLRERARVGQ
jgi:glutathione S-transferase